MCSILFTIFQQVVADLSEYGDICEYNYGRGPDDPPTTVYLKKEFQRKILYQMSPEEVTTNYIFLLSIFKFYRNHLAVFICLLLFLSLVVGSLIRVCVTTVTENS